MRVPLQIYAVLAVSVLIAGCAPATQQVDREAVLTAAHTLDKTFLDALNNGDADAIAACYAEDAVAMMPDEMIATGRPAIREAFDQMFSSMPGCQLEMTESHDIVIGDAVASYGLWRMTVTAEDGTKTTMDGRYTDVKAERDGKWVYLTDHASVPMPEMMPAPMSEPMSKK